MSAKDAVLRYLKQQNRPYSANDITQNLHKEFGKTAIQKALDDLSANGLIKEKIYGKQKVYAPLQDDDVDQSVMQTVLSELDAKIEEASKELVTSEQQLKALEAELKSLGSEMSMEEALNEEKELEKLVNQLTEKLNSLSSNQVCVSAEEKKNIAKNHEKIVSEYRKRKRICMDIANTILENYPKSKKVFFEEVGIETDEDIFVNSKQ